MTDLRSGKPTWEELDRMYWDAVKIIAEQKAELDKLRAVPATGRELAEQVLPRMEHLSNDERVLVFRVLSNEYCEYCGQVRPESGCRCDSGD